MNWLLLMEIVYLLIIVAVCFRIIYDTENVNKTLGYLLLVIFLPILGIFIYFSLGINYRKNKLYSKKIVHDKIQEEKILKRVEEYNRTTLDALDSPDDFVPLSKMIYTSDQSPITQGNEVDILSNGEEKFPEVIKALKEAKHHIHLQYYIFEDDQTGRAIEEVLIQKAQEGVEIRFLYDDFGSSSIRKTLVRRLREKGIQALPFYKIRILPFANRINYRNHRKIIVIDGITSFVGGINISDKYSNIYPKNKYYWRDTHLKISGPATALLQHIFIADWNFCTSEHLPVTTDYFPTIEKIQTGGKFVQIVSSGPDSDRPSIYYALVQMLFSAKKEVLITSPYFIPGETIMDAMIIASLSGVKVKLLVPGVSDSFFVNAAARSYYRPLLQAGVEIYLYQKGFIHAKTMVADEEVAMVGTANMDYRSFDLNFEVNAIVYDKEKAKKLRQEILSDMQIHSKKLSVDEWLNRPAHIRLFEKTVRLLSPLL